MDPALPNARVEERRLEARVGAHQEDEVGLLHARDTAVQQVVRPQVSAGIQL